MAADAKGFALLEVLIAFVIAALALGVLTEAALDGLRGTRVALQYEEALSRARSHLAAMGQGGALVAGAQQGDDGGGFGWRSRIAPLATAPVAHGDVATVARGPRVTLYAVSVAVTWHAGRRDRGVELTGELVGRAPPAGP